MQIACELGKIDVLPFLLDLKLPLSMCLHHLIIGKVSQISFLQTLSILLPNGIDLCEQDEEGRTPFMLAAQSRPNQLPGLVIGSICPAIKISDKHGNNGTFVECK